MNDQEAKEHQLLQKLRDRPCTSKEELGNWIKVFLKTDLPEVTLDPDSNCNPLEMCWLVYKNMIWYNDLPDDEKITKFLFYATRAGFKTLSAAILELLAMIHDERGTAHIAAGESHVKHCYNDYFQPLTKLPLINEKIKSSIMEKTTLANNEKVFVEIMPCTKQRVQGPHQPFVVKDEIDVVQNVSAYSDIDGIPVDMPDKRPPITMGISVRKTAYGLVQKEIDEADERGVKVYHWNLLDITEKCPDSRSGVKKKTFFVKKDSLESITKEEYSTLPVTKQDIYEPYEGREYCLTNCKMFGACRGLLKNQTSKSKWLKSIEYTEKKFTESKDEEMIIAQFLCRKPPSTGQIYPKYSAERNERTYTQMYEMFTGLEPDDEITKIELIQIFKQHGIPCYFGIDFGFDPDPCVALAIFIDKMKNIYVIDEFYEYRITEAELALWLKTHWRSLYKPDLVYPDIASPGGRRELIKAGFRCAGSKRLKGQSKEGGIENVIKDVKPGIGTVRAFICLPAKTEGKLFINPVACPMLAYEIPRYHNKTDADGTIVSDKPALGQKDHACDALRYPVHSILGVGLTTMMLDIAPPVKMGKPMEKAPTAVQVGELLGVNIKDNRHILDDDKDDKDDGDEGGGGFSFTF